MTVQCGRTAVRLHPVLPLLWLSALLGGRVTPFFGAAAALLLHESGHLLCAALLRIPILEIEITPLGGMMTTEAPEALPTFQGVLLSLAGPLFSYGGCCLAGAAVFQDYAFCLALARCSLLLLLINCLPVLPLDGGCAVRYLLHRFLPWQRSTVLLVRLGWIAAAFLCGLSLIAALKGEMLLSPMLAGLYLLYAGHQEEKQSPGRYVTALIGRRGKLERWQALPVETLAVSGSMPARMLLNRMHAGKYHLVRVLSPDGMRCLGQLDEGEICDLILDHVNEPVAFALSKKRP